MDAGVRKRLETIVESKNLTMEKIYGQKPVSVDGDVGLVREIFQLFAPICDVGDYLDKADREGQKIMFGGPSWALCVTSTSASILTRLPPTPCPPMHPSVAGIPGPS